MSEQLDGTRELPKFTVREERNDRYVQVRLQEVQNGFIVRSGDVPIYYPSINEAAEAGRLSRIVAAVQHVTAQTLLPEINKIVRQGLGMATKMPKPGFRQRPK